MEPTLHCAQPGTGCLAKERDLVYAVPYGDSRPVRGDIVVFQAPAAAGQRCGAGGLFIKRVVGLPLEHWRERAGMILINGEEIPEPYVKPGRRDRVSYPRAVIPLRRYLLLGDNRAHSCDSRIYGPIALGSIRGKIVEIRRGSKRIHLR